MVRRAPWWPKYEKLMVTEVRRSQYFKASCSHPWAQCVLCSCQVVVALYQKIFPFQKNMLLTTQRHLVSQGTIFQRLLTLFKCKKLQLKGEKYFTQQSLPNLQKRQKNQKCGTTLFLISQQQRRDTIFSK